MPSTSPGSSKISPSKFFQILPGTPSDSLQGVACFAFRQKHYIAYTSGRHLSICSGPNVLLQCVPFAEEPVAVTAERHTGRLAVASKKSAWVLKPVTEGWTTVAWEKSLLLQWDNTEENARTLSWGIEEEVLVGGDKQLSLFSTIPSSPTEAALSRQQEFGLEQRTPLWSIRLPSPVQYAAFNPSATLIATCGVHDRLIKVWRRLSFEEGLFDYMYIPHPSAVTFLQWRPPAESLDHHELEDDAMPKKHNEDAELLYTIATDGVLRVWRTGTVHDLDVLSLHTTIDLVPTVPDSPSLSFREPIPSQQTRPNRYTCLIPAEQFNTAVKNIIGVQDATNNKHSSEHFREVLSKDPDVVISFDGRGRMSAWGLQSVGHKRRPDSPLATPVAAFSIAHEENLPIRILEGVNAIFEAWLEGRVFNLVAHSIRGELRWWQGDAATLFSPALSAATQLTEVAYWAGHSSGSIDALATSVGHRCLLSVSTENELVYFESTVEGTLQQASSYQVSGTIIDAALVTPSNGAGHCSLLLQRDGVDTSSTVALSLCDAVGRVIARLTEPFEEVNEAERLQLFTSDAIFMDGQRAVVLSSHGTGYTCKIQTSSPALDAPIGFALPVLETNDPVRHCEAILDSSHPDRFGIIALTESGHVLLYHLESPLDANSDAEPVLIATFRSGVVGAERLTSNNDFAFVVSACGSELVIVNLTDGYVEHRYKSDQRIRQVVPSLGSSLVVVVTDSTVDILAQGRIGYREEMAPWVQIKRMSMADLGLDIAAVTWLSDGSLAIGAGSCILISSNAVVIDEMDQDVREATGVEEGDPQTMRMSTIAQQLGRPLPTWHPTFIAHIVRFGQWSLAASLINRLLEKLKFWSEGDHLQPLLNIPASQLYGAEGIQDERTLDRDTVSELTQQLKSKDLPDISQAEQRRLLCVLEAMMFCSEHVGALDNLALRYLYTWKFDLLLMKAKHPGYEVELDGMVSDGQPLVPEMHWREVAFAFHSTTQQPLLDILVAHYDNKITWRTAKLLGLFAWLSDREALDQIFESLAQTAYRASSPPEPINAALYFLALHKKQTLLGLWRIATWHKEQRATMNFLRRDFSLPESQTAAKKNAYALMGKRRFEYAAAFFLLAGDGASALSVLAGQCGDVMLAIAVGRLFSGDTSSAIQKLVQDRLVPQARQSNDRWLLNWSYSLLLEKDAAISVLVEPLDGVRSWHQDDPALLDLYARLRRVESEYEFDVVLRSARILRRMGLWLIALEVVNRWQFKHLQRAKKSSATVTSRVTVNGVEAKAPHSMLDDFNDNSDRQPKSTPSMLDDFMDSSPLPNKVKPAQDGEGPIDESTAREAKAAELLKTIKAKKKDSVAAVTEKRAPTQFREPDPNSLLDSFGF